MEISNFTGIVNIRKGSSLKEYKLAQIPNTTAYDTDDSRYEATYINVSDYGVYNLSLGLSSDYRQAYPNYIPGKSYIPDKSSSFKLNECIPKEKVDAMAAAGYASIKEGNVQFSQYFMNVDNYFCWDEENNIWGAWYVTSYFYHGSVYYMWIDMRLALFSFKVTQSMVNFIEADNGYRIQVNSPGGIFDSPDGQYWLADDIFRIEMHDATGGTYSPEERYRQVLFKIDRWYNKATWYYAHAKMRRQAVYTNNNYYFTPNQSLANNDTVIDSLTILADLDVDQFYPSKGFCMVNDWSGVRTIYPALVTLTWGSGPKNDHPDHRDDDPNDDDKKPNPDDKGGDGDHDDTYDKIPKPGLPGLSASHAGLITIFNPSVSELREISSKLWSPDAWDAIKQYFTTPLDAVLGLGIIPVAPSVSGKSNVLLGLYDTEVSANVVASDYVIIDCGSIPITRYYGSYLDYSPYTHIKCYLPYIGEIDISPDEAMQKTLNIQYYINVVTGDTVAMCLLNGDLFYTATGNCIRQLPLSSTDYSSIINTAVNAVSTIMTAAATADVGAAAVESVAARPKVTEESKKLASAQATANNVGSSTALLNNITGAKMRYNHAGSMGTGAGQLCRQKPYLIIERPNLDLASNYKGFVGYPCNKTKQISACQGYTQIEASNITVANATDIELSMIKEILMEGVIL